MKINEVIVAPVLTEKATTNSNNGVYTFVVDINSTKSTVKTALEKIYKVKVKSVRVFLRKGKMVRKGRRFNQKKLADRKIAYVKLKEGKLDIFPQS